MNLSHTGEVVGGKLVLDNPHLLREVIKSLDGREVKLELSVLHGTRTQKMNRYYWGVVLSTITKYFNEEWTFNSVVSTSFVHELLKVKFLGTKKIIIPGNEVIEVVNSSAKLTIEEFQEYCNHIIDWAADFLNLTIPPPDSSI